MSHSVSPEDRALLDQVEAELGSIGVSLYLAERAFAPTSVTEKIKGAIQSSDFVVVLLTKAGASSSYVNQEIAIAETLAKPIIPLLEEGVAPPGIIGERDQIRFSRGSFRAAFGRVTDYVRKNFPAPEEKVEAPAPAVSDKTDDLLLGIGIGLAIAAVVILLVWALTRE